MQDSITANSGCWWVSGRAFCFFEVPLAAGYPPLPLQKPTQDADVNCLRICNELNIIGSSSCTAYDSYSVPPKISLTTEPLKTSSEALFSSLTIISITINYNDTFSVQRLGVSSLKLKFKYNLSAIAEPFRSLQGKFYGCSFVNAVQTFNLSTHGSLKWVGALVDLHESYDPLSMFGHLRGNELESDFKLDSWHLHPQQPDIAR
jgi:hypothetical protein